MIMVEGRSMCSLVVKGVCVKLGGELNISEQKLTIDVRTSILSQA